MASTSLGDKILVTFNGRLLGETVMNTFWYQVSALTGTPNTSSFASALYANLNAGGGLIESFLACCPDNYTLVETWIQFVEPLRVVKSVFLTNESGTWGVDTDTTNLAGVITRRGDLAGRSHVGSLHVPISSDPTSIQLGELSGVLTTRMTTLCTDMASSQALTGVGTANPVLRNGPLTTDVTLINSCFVQTEVRIMRRRTVRVGI